MQIYVELLNEGVAVWRPVEAIHNSDDVYTIISKNNDTDNEHWQYGIGNMALEI